jgi:hypothetical protein
MIPMADIAALTEQLRDELFAQHERQRELAYLKREIASRAKQIEALSDEIDSAYRAESTATELENTI